MAIWFTDPLVAVLLRQFGISNFSGEPSALDIIIPIVAVKGLFMLFAWLDAEKIRKMRLIDTNIRCNPVAPGATVTPAHLANKAGEQPGGAKMLEYSGHYVYFPGPECDPMDQAYACLYLASKIGRHVKVQVLQVCNGAFL